MGIAFVEFIVLFCTCSAVSGILTQNDLLCLIFSPDQTVRSSRGIKANKKNFQGENKYCKLCGCIFCGLWKGDLFRPQSRVWK